MDVDLYLKRPRGAPDGGANYRNGRLFSDTLRRALIQQDGKKLRAVIEAMCDKAAQGDTAMIALIIDRVDGKARSMMEMHIEKAVEEMSDEDIRRAIASNQRLIEASAGTGNEEGGEGIVTDLPVLDANPAATSDAP